MSIDKVVTKTELHLTSKHFRLSELMDLEDILQTLLWHSMYLGHFFKKAEMENMRFSCFFPPKRALNSFPDSHTKHVGRHMPCTWKNGMSKRHRRI